MPFRSLGLDPRILQAIQEAGYTEPTPIQAAAIPQILTGQDLIGIAQTGTGKTAAFTLPILTHLASLQGQGRMRSTKALILAPTRELVAQIKDNIDAYAKHLPLRVAMIFGGVGERPQIQALRDGADIIIATPGRLIDLMGQRHGNFSNLECLVLDEADRMLDMGFLPSIKRIVKALPSRRQTLMFSATLSREIEALTHEFQQRPKTVQIGKRSNPAESVTQLVYEVPQHLKSPLLLHLLVDPSFNTVLVFAKMKHGADRIARYLDSYGVKTATLHSNRTQNQRLRALADFKSGAVRVLIATDIAARGIDVDGISHVINYDFPKAPEDYIHRIGRTGRAQAIGDAISFVTKEDHGSLKALERFINRGLIRKQAEGFDYTVSPGANHDVAQRERKPRQPGDQNQSTRNSRPNRSNPINPRGRDSQRSSGGGTGGGSGQGQGQGNRSNRPNRPEQTGGLRRGESPRPPRSPQS
ncbi:DEAD/DEAH box helicase [Phragmitibacter flavus]|uniref:DEAD-box ATP-dependent RNA helicase RhpA n=1 Tax=Phragmitibacter flavus TaxID=2576071 RepID=A0A5R8KAS8_9BACT|nr:DEAD/DEAH box helicase [Phragmitibacter flavus]TLD69418.1 DEAD/DEAH box helicase [Phragmitibacter flavus]